MAGLKDKFLFLLGENPKLKRRRWEEGWCVEEGWVTALASFSSNVMICFYYCTCNIISCKTKINRGFIRSCPNFFFFCH
ncbi:hypothetical protein RchiOBHm_Chr3g0492681 [Rosa chinensis]|uniref:Uncharacterized protein n=1 Tax=Rosa chinensis TaxID=74649 RepID=A0A2P6RGK1_ROSCH|nr:hypothetical protein RchiOBHm_Chr3g0492681 [Rosa chinensis]